MAITIIDAKTLPDDMSAGTICRSSLWSDDSADCFFGRKEDLIAARIVEANQFPPEGVRGISWAQGERVTRKCRKDETYRRVDSWGDDIWRVNVGLPRNVAAARRKAEKEKWQAERAAKEEEERGKALRQARWALHNTPRTECAFRLEIIKQARDMIRLALDASFEPSDCHGFVVAEASADDIRLSFDAVVEAIRLAEVKCDHAKQTRIVSEKHAAIVAAGGGVADKVAALTRPNPALLQGEAA